MKLSLNLFTHNLTISLRRKRRLMTATDCAKELGLKPMTVRNYGRIEKVKRKGTKIVGISKQTAFLYDLEEVRKVAFG